MQFFSSKKFGSEVEPLITKLQPYLEELRLSAKDSAYSKPESALFLPFDENIQNEVLRITAAKKTDTLQYIFVIGIGGSSQGAKAIYQATRLWSDLVMGSTPRIVFIESINSFLLEKVSELFKNTQNPDEVLFLFISKSGTTKETLANWSVLKSIFVERFTENDLPNRTVVITSSSDAGPEGERVSIPEKVGGRFSVFSAVGLLPLALSGIDIVTMLKRAREYTQNLFTSDADVNPALQSALFAYSEHQEGRPVYDHFFFRSELSALGQWSRQLLAESLGKRHDIRLLPTVSLGSNDLHSSLQRTLGASADTATCFVWVPPVTSQLHTIQDVEKEGTALYQATKKAYSAKGLHYVELILDDFLDTGIFMQTKMVETMLLGKLFDVDAFNQPSVEEYKKLFNNL